MSSSADTFLTDPYLLNSGGNPHPVPRKDLSIGIVYTIAMLAADYHCW